MTDETANLILAHMRKVITKLDILPDRMQRIEMCFNAMEIRFGALESRFAALEQRMAGVEFHLQQIERRLGLEEPQ